MFNAIAKLALGAIVLASLGACGNLSRGVAKDGNGAQELVWPKPEDTTPIHRGGTFPSLDALRQMKPGVNKPQIAALIGYPHFTEGVWGVREWNYLFNFRKPGTDEVTVCQYKVLFDEHKLARSFYWKPESCADLLKPAPAPVAEAAAPRHYTLAADALFAFDKANLADIRPEGREELDHLAGDLAAHREQIVSIQVLGYSDRLGTHAYNEKLSMQRAQTVRDYLAAHGVPAATITAEGRGEADPQVECNEGKHSALVACLAPNRRVEVIARTR